MNAIQPMNRKFWSKSAQSQAALWSLSVGVAVVIAISTTINLSRRLPYPPGMDQDWYLETGQSFAEHFVFMWRTPIYSAWMGTIYLLSGESVKTTFFAEKIAAVALLSLLVCWLGWQIFDKWTGLLMAVWVWNCKYLLLETNGSHTLASSLFVLSLLCLYLPADFARTPLAVLLLFLSGMCRLEMRVVAALVVGHLLVRYFVAWRCDDRAKKVMAHKELLAWAVVVFIAAGLYALFMIRVSTLEPSIPGHAFRQNFAANYVERKGVSDKYPDAWRQNPVIWNEVLPGATTPIDALIKYPGEVIGHFYWNLKLLIRALPANVLALYQPLLMLLLFGLWAWAYWVAGESGSGSVFKLDAQKLLPAWLAAILVLIPITIVLRVAARYYQQLIVVEMIVLLTIARATMMYLKRWWLSDKVEARGVEVFQ
jgi:hypothetical protein